MDKAVRKVYRWRRHTQEIELKEIVCEPKDHTIVLIS